MAKRSKAAVNIDFKKLFEANSWNSILREYNFLQKRKVLVDPEISYIYCIALFNTSSFSQCAHHCSEIVDHFKDSPSFYSMWGAALRRSGDVQKSREIFATALERFPSDPLISNNFSNLLIDLDELDQAKEILEKLLEASVKPSNYSDIQNNLLRIKQLQDRVSESKESSSSTLVNEADTSSFSFQQDPLLFIFSDSEVKHASASPPLPVVQKINKEELSERMVLARKLCARSPKEALSELKALSNYLVTNPTYYAIQGEAYVALKWYDKAEIAFATSVILGATEYTSYINLANISHMKGGKKLSAFYLSKAKDLGASDALLAKVKATYH